METRERANGDLSRETAGMAVSPPFDAERLDELMEEAGIDALVVTSKHNIQYLLGGYRFFFFDHFDAIGVSRYLPVLVYAKGHPGRSTYIGHPMENYERELGGLWVPTFHPSARTSTDGMKLAVEQLSALGPKAKRIGIERAFLPADAESVLRAGLPQAELVEAQLPLERLRAVKTAEELDHLRVASELVVDSMLAVIAGHGPGATKNELVEALRREEVNRGLNFEYCLITAATSFNRAPSNQIWREGDILSLTPAATTKAISATSAGWPFSVSPTPNSKTCWARSTPFNRPRDGRSGTALAAATFSLRRKSWCGIRRTATRWNSSPTAWA